MHSVPKDFPGEPAAFWLFALVAPPLGQMVSRDGFALPDPEPIILSAAYRYRLSSEGDPDAFFRHVRLTG